MVTSYQAKQTENSMKSLTEYAATIDGRIMQLNSTIRNIYSGNDSFNNLDSYPTVAKQWNQVNALFKLMQIQIQSDYRLEGLFLFYSEFTNYVYHVQSKMPFTDKEVLKLNAINEMQSGKGGLLTFLSTTDHNLYFNSYIKKNSVGIGGSISLKAELLTEAEEEETYGVLYHGNFYTTNDGDDDMKTISFEILKLGKNKRNGYIIYVQDLETANLSVVKFTPNHVRQYLNIFHVFYLLLCIILSIIARILYSLMTEQIIKPLENMNNALIEIKASHWEVEFDSDNRVIEIENVRDSVRLLLSEIEQWKIRNYEEQLDKKNMELQYLHLQLAPHFYTNCLKNIYCMLVLKEYSNAQDFIMRLSVHVRYLLRSDVALVMIDEEKKFTENYIHMQKLISDTDIVCEITFDEEIRDVMIPVLTLQTFVENSIKYALGVHEGCLRIKMSIKLRKTESRNYLDITIRDNGQGYPSEVIEMIQKKELKNLPGLGVGIINLLSRMKIHYGNEVTWYFENNNGAFSEMIIPLDD